MFSQPTIKDVAKAAGVHFTTVSMALRAHPSIPAATRERILAAAARVGYRRNPVFAALTSQRLRGAEEYFVPKMAYLGNRSPEEGFYKLGHNQLLVEGARRQAEVLGYSLEVLFLDKNHHDSASLSAYLEKHSITGLIIGAFQPGRMPLELDWAKYSLVKIDSRHMAPDVSFVSTDQYSCVRESLRRMQTLGYSRVGMAIGLDDETSTDCMHLSGWFLEQSRRPESARVPPLVLPSHAKASEVEELLRRYIPEHGLDGIICNWTNIRAMLRGAGFAGPEGVACSCLCLCKPMPGLAGIVTNMDLVGERAVSILAAQMRSEQRGVPSCVINTYVQGIWRNGASASQRN